MKADIGRIISTLLNNLNEIEKQKGQTLIMIDKDFNLTMANENSYPFIFREINGKKIKIIYYELEEEIIKEIVRITESKEHEIIVKDNIIYNLKLENIITYEDIVHINYKILEKIDILR